MSSLTVGKINVSKRPMFYAQPSASQSFTADGQTVTSWQVNLNVGGGSLSNGIYTIPEAGFYKIELSFLKYSTSTDVGFYLNKNNTQVQRLVYLSTPNTWSQGAGSCILDCAENDELKITSYGGSSTVQIYGASDASSVGNWTIYKLG